MDQAVSQAEKYLADHDLQAILAKAVNAAYSQRAPNPHKFLSEFLALDGGAAVIEEVGAREVLDSRGNPTVEVDIYNKLGELIGRAAAPSGASTGSNEALELRDKDPARYLGKGVQQAVENVREKIAPALHGADVRNLRECDRLVREADGTELKTNIGGNAVTATSFAVAEAGARQSHRELWEHFADVFHEGNLRGRKFSIPTPLINILNGGKHAGGKLKIQEFMIVPRRGIRFTEAIRMSAEVYHHLGKILVSRYGVSASNLGDEGGFAPSLDTPDQALDAIEEAVRAAGYRIGDDVRLALDCAASEFYKDGKYEIEAGKFLSSAEVVDYYAALVERHPALISIEDSMDEKDYDGWKLFMERLGQRVMVVGDDLFTTNTRLIEQGLAESWANALLLKVNQIGTISEAMDAARMLYEVSGQVIVSHRSGETPGSLIADLAVGIGAGYIKTGATARGERVSKYNRLLAIEEELDRRGLLEIRD